MLNLVAAVQFLVSKSGLLGPGDGSAGMAVRAVLHRVADNYRPLIEGCPLWHVAGAFGMVFLAAC